MHHFHTERFTTDFIISNSDLWGGHTHKHTHKHTYTTNTKRVERTKKTNCECILCIGLLAMGCKGQGLKDRRGKASTAATGA